METEVYATIIGVACGCVLTIFGERVLDYIRKRDLVGELKFENSRLREMIASLEREKGALQLDLATAQKKVLDLEVEHQKRIKWDAIKNDYAFNADEGTYTNSAGGHFCPRCMVAEPPKASPMIHYDYLSRIAYCCPVCRYDSARMQ